VLALAGAVLVIAAGLAYTARLVHIGNLDALALADKMATPDPVSALDWPELHVRAVLPQPGEPWLVLLLAEWPARPGQAATLLISLDRGDQQSVPLLSQWCASLADQARGRMGRAPAPAEPGTGPGARRRGGQRSRAPGFAAGRGAAPSRASGLAARVCLGGLGERGQGREMMIVIGLWLVLVGGIAVLAGLTARQRVLRLRRSGQPAWGMVVPSPVSAGDPASGSSRRYLIQYPLADGRVIERLCPPPIRKAAWPALGQKVPVWYDPADPADVLVNGWDGRFSDRAFLAMGVFFILFGLAIAFSH
jgi:hypothetical protein